MRSLIRRRGGDPFLHVERVWHDVRHGARVFVRNPALIAVTSLAAAIPARHAARINPTVALRCE